MLIDERRERGLLTQQEVCKQAGCSAGRLQYHTRHGHIEPPAARLESRLYYTSEQVLAIAAYFANRKRWDRLNGERRSDAKQ